MRLTAIILFAASLHVSAAGFGQTVTLSGKGVPLEKIFSEIKVQTGYVFFFDQSWLALSKKVSVDLRDEPLASALDICFRDQPLTYSIVGNTIVVRLKETPALNESAAANAPPGEIRGRITNGHGEPLPNANIIIKRTKRGTITNANGEFILKSVHSDDVLSISFIGYKTLTVRVGAGREFPLVMETTTNELDKVVVQAYGKTSRRLTTSDIGVVTKEEIEKQPVMNPLLTLQGRVAGLDVTQTSGYASAPVKVELRGRNFINGQFTSDPLYIIDGVPLTVLEISGNSNYNAGSYGFLQSGIGGPANGQSPLFNINPMDIESIEVLKDADATAIYGSRGANGVILITTKKGKTGKTQFDLRVNAGINKVTKYWDVMNLQQYLSMRREAYKNDGRTPTLSNGGYDLLAWDTTKSIDWQRTLYGGTGKNLDAEASLSGGDAHTTFRIGAGYTRATSILTVSGAEQRGSLSISLSHRSTNGRFTVSASSSYSYTQTDMVSLPSGAVLLPPDAPPIYDSAGNLNYNGWGAGNTRSRSAFIFGPLKCPYTSKTNFLNSSLGLDFQPLRGLKLIANFGYNNALATQQFFTTIASQDPLSDPTGSAQFGNNRNSNWIVEPQTTYEAILGEGKLSLMAGGSIQHLNTDGTQLNGSGYTSDDLIRTITNAPVQYSADSYGEYRYAAIFARANYIWKDKYVLNLNGRRDGSSRFGPGKQFGNFWSVGAAWIFTEESWFKNHFELLSFGKIRGSYGATGSDAVGDYGYLTRWSSNNALPYGGFQPLYPTQHANPDFHWQVNKKLEAAIDLAFVKDKYHISVAYYRDRCGDQLLSFPTPILSGFGTVIANSPALVQNSGLEFTVSAKVVDKKDVTWTISFNTAINKNKLLAYPNISQSPYAHSLVVGQPLNIVNVYHYLGVDPQTGIYGFVDRNHDGQFSIFPNSPSDDSYHYNLSPEFFGGLGTNFSYKNLQVSLFFNIKKARGVNAYFLSGSMFGKLKNAPAEILGKEWKNPGDVATIAKFSTVVYSNLATNSDIAYTDASFIRLSSLSLSYSLPADYMRKIGMQNCSIFIYTNNLFVITNYKGLDPETQNFGGMPPNKVITGGISFNF